MHTETQIRQYKKANARMAKITNDLIEEEHTTHLERLMMASEISAKTKEIIRGELNDRKNAQDDYA